MQSVYASSEPFIPFNAGGGPAYVPVEWLLDDTTNDAGLLTATAGFHNASASGRHKGSNNGEGLRVAARMKPLAPYYDIFGLFDAAGSQLPNINSTYYGFSSYQNGIDVLRVGDSWLPVQLAVPSDAELRVELWNDSVRFYIDDTEIHRLPAPAPAANYVPGLSLYRSGNTWSDGQIYAQNLTPR